MAFFVCVSVVCGVLVPERQIISGTHFSKNPTSSLSSSADYHSRKFRPHTFRLARKVEVFTAEVLRIHKNTK